MLWAPTDTDFQNLSKIIIRTLILGVEATVLAILGLTVNAGNITFLSRKHWQAYYLLGSRTAVGWVGYTCWIRSRGWRAAGVSKRWLSIAPVALESQESCNIFLFVPAADTLPPGRLFWRWWGRTGTVFLSILLKWPGEMKCHCCAWRVDLSRYPPFLTLYAAVSFTCPMTLALTAYSSCWFSWTSLVWGQDSHVKLRCSPSRYPSLLYASRNALGTDGCALVAMAPRDVAVITEAVFQCLTLYITYQSWPL